MTNSDDVTTIAPAVDAFPDAEERYLVCLIATLHAASHYTIRCGEARRARDRGHEGYELVSDELTELRRGLVRALERRRRDLGTLLHNKRVQGGV